MRYFYLLSFPLQRDEIKANEIKKADKIKKKIHYRGVKLRGFTYGRRNDF